MWAPPVQIKLVIAAVETWECCDRAHSLCPPPAQLRFMISANVYKGHSLCPPAAKVGLLLQACSATCMRLLRERPFAFLDLLNHEVHLMWPSEPSILCL